MPSVEIREVSRLQRSSNCFPDRPPPVEVQLVTITYEFVEAVRSTPKKSPWSELRGALKGVFAELGGGETYLRREREAFESRKEDR